MEEIGGYICGVLQKVMEKATPAAQASLQRRKRVPKAEAQKRLIEATIILLRQLPFNEVGNQVICAQADLNPSTILQHFGTLDNLLAEAAKELVDRHIDARSASGGELTTFTDPDIALRSRLVAWLVLQGYPADQLRSGIIEDESVMALQQEVLKVGPRMASAWTSITTMIIEANSILGAIHQIDEHEAADMLALMLRLRQDLPEVEVALGWDQQP